MAGWGGPLRGLLKAAGAVALALALSAIYWLPALVELPYSRLLGPADWRVHRHPLPPWAPPDLLQPLVIFDYYVEAIPRYGLTAALLTLGSAALVLLAVLRRLEEHGRTWWRAWTALGPDRDGSSSLCAALFVGGAAAPAPDLGGRLGDRAADLVRPVPAAALRVRLCSPGRSCWGAAPWAVSWLRLVGQPGSPSLAGAVIGVLLGATSLPGIYWTWPVAASHVIGEDHVGIWMAAERRLSERRAFDDYFPAGSKRTSNEITPPPTANRAEVYRAATRAGAAHEDSWSAATSTSWLRSRGPTPPRR